MNLTDLQRVLDEKAGGVADPGPHELRLAGVRGKVMARRRQRVGAWAAAVVALAVAVTVAVAPNLRADRAFDPATTSPPVRLIEGFPEYSWGARVLAARQVALPVTRLALNVNLTTLDLRIFFRCEGGDDGIHFEHRITIDGVTATEGVCAGAAGVSPQRLAERGVRTGPATVELVILRAVRVPLDGPQVEVPIPARGTIAFAIGERVPFADYPFPSRPPGPLRSWEGMLPAGCTPVECPDTVIIGSDPTDPGRPVRRTLTWQTVRSVEMAAQTPGRLHLIVEGVTVATGEWWDYSTGGVGVGGEAEGEWKTRYGLDLRPGDRVTVEIIPEHVTGPWQVVLMLPGSIPE
jgi:hypothetical protein